jgi:large subunit ribosomal protein L10Ae
LVKVSADTLASALKQILDASNGPNKRNFLESIELQIGLKNYDPQRDKRFSGSYRLPNISRPNMKFCLIGDAKHMDDAVSLALGIDTISGDDLKKFNKNKKLIKKWAHKYDGFIASDSLIRQIPRLLGPQLNKMGMFPTPVTHADDLKAKLDELKSTVKFQLKKVLCLGVAVGHVNMTHEQLRTHLLLTINFLISLLKKGWQNIRTLHIKSSMGEVHRIY